VVCLLSEEEDTISLRTLGLGSYWSKSKRILSALLIDVDYGVVVEDFPSIYLLNREHTLAFNLVGTSVLECPIP